MPSQLDLNKTYRAILGAARAKRFITYGDLATANGAEWPRVRRLMPGHLGELVRIAAARNWPMPSAIVVIKENVENGRLEGDARNGFINAARENGFDISNPAAFVRQQQQAVFAWAEQAPDELSSSEEDDLFADPNKQFWFVGAMWDDDDQTQRFIDEGTWENGYALERYADLVAQVQAGDGIVIKSVSTRADRLPFDNRGDRVSYLRVKAIGTVTSPTNDGHTVGVEWHQLDEPRDWYIYTGKYRTTIAMADVHDDRDRRLIQFAFSGHEQDMEYWVDYHRRRYRSGTSQRNEQEEFQSEARYGIRDISEDGCFLKSKSLESTMSLLKSKHNLILQGPPGTGKTWLAKRLGYALMGTKDPSVVRNRMCSIQFHPSLSYEDFVRGWRPGGDGQLSLIDGVFLRAINKANEARKARAEPPLVVVIEEINRGNPAQIFGEMLTLLERDKRCKEEAIELAYRRNPGERVFIPDNLFLIGTMNIADRSLALVDLALRRRFAFVGLEPAFNKLWRKWCVTQANVDKSVLKHIQDRMFSLNNQIADDRTLGAQFRIGHSYFTPAPGESIDDSRLWFRAIVESEIAPLLEEYWFDNLAEAEKAKKQLLRDL